MCCLTLSPIPVHTCSFLQYSRSLSSFLYTASQKVKIINFLLNNISPIVSVLFFCGGRSLLEVARAIRYFQQTDIYVSFFYNLNFSQTCISVISIFTFLLSFSLMSFIQFSVIAILIIYFNLFHMQVKKYYTIKYSTINISLDTLLQNFQKACYWGTYISRNQILLFISFVDYTVCLRSLLRKFRDNYLGTTQVWNKKS